MAILGGCLTWLKGKAEAWIKEQGNHLKSYGTRVRELQAAIKELKDALDIVERKFDEEKRRYRRRNDKVEKWKNNVNDLISQYGKFHLDKGHEYAKFDLFTTGYLPKPGIRYRLSRKANEIAKNVDVALQQVKTLDEFSYWRGPPSVADFFADIGYKSLPSRDETVKKITVALKDPGVRMIGVHGLSGVGKTTLAKEVAKRALKNQVFDVVIMITVTRSVDIKGIQGQIADTLGMTLQEESEIGRAAHIRDTLMGNEKEKTLIILDDLREKLDLNMLGFPSMNDDGNLVSKLKDEKSGKVPDTSTMVDGKDLYGASKSNTVQTEQPVGRHKWCKIMMISETEQVLSSQMEGKARSSVFYVEVELLKEQEAETLFKNVAEIGDKKNPEFEKLAPQIASKCSGLPMSIVTTAKALKNKSPPVWEDTYRKLERENFSGVPELSIRLSYELLENEELKYTFLLCARMGRDILIMDFVRYCIGLGFLQGIYTVAEARDRVMSLLLELKKSGLLSDSYSSNRFTMQNIVQGAALSIASKEKQVFMMTKGKLDEWPDEDELERYTAISLQHCDIEFPQILKCSRLKVLHVDSLDPRLEIPDKFFEEMKELRVLILIGINLSPSLPSSFKQLTKLRMLCLVRCTLDGPLSIIGELKNLRILSLAGSDFKELPDELKQLAKLQILDISDCSKLVIPPNVISRLTNLEDLYMRNTSIQWKVEGQEKQSDNASLSELRDLIQLTTLDIQIQSVDHLPEDLFFDKLDNYKIVIGDLNAYLERDFKMPEKYETSKFLALQIKEHFIHTQKGIKMLFESVENLLLGELHGVTHVFHELNLKGFPYLRHLSIVSNSDIQYIIKSEKHPEKAFTKLESMCLYNLIKMEHICHGQFKDASFSKLKIIKISMCYQLKNVFFFSMVEFLSALETIEVFECNSLKEIVTVGNSTDEIKFPKLRTLKLESLSKFVGFCTTSKELFDERVVVSELERVELSSLNKIQKIWSDKPLSSFGKLTHMDVSDCGSLTYLLSSSMAEKLVNLQSLSVSKCGMMENIFNPEEVGKGSVFLPKHSRVFPKLKNIKLRCLKKLRSIWQSKGLSNSYDNLESLIIEDCDKLEHVFAADMVGRFRSLCNLRVTSCASMRVIFDLKVDGKGVAGPGNVTKLQNVHLEALPKLEHIWEEKPEETILNFQSLQKIWVRRCPSLKHIFPVSVAKGLKVLEYLVVLDCGRLKHIIAKGNIKIKFPKLANAHFSGLPKLESLYLGAKLIFPALNELSIELCDRLEPFEIETADQPQPQPQSRPAEDQLEPFTTETTDQPQSIETAFFPAKIIYNLKSMLVEQRDAKWLKDYIGDYRMYNLEELRFSTLLDYEILYFFLHRSPNLKSLWLNNCFFEELVPRANLAENEKLGVVPKLKMLKLIDLPSLRDIGFKRDKILQRIESLILEKCPRLITILPPSVSFTDLTYLEVVNCDDLTDLMAPSTAKSLVQLITMKVNQCKRMKEIVSQKGDESNITIVFRKLKALELVYLPRLICFCSSESCTFLFPSLEKLVVSQCPALESFASDKNRPPNLRQIYIAHRQVGPRSCLWEGDINATIKKISEDKLYLLAADKAELRDPLRLINGVKRQGFPFDSLKTLKLKDCSLGSHAITATLLPNLKNLTNLHVQNCSPYKVIFDTKDIKGATFLLKKLTLNGLPNLANVWDKNSTEEVLLSFQNLQKVVVANCTSLKFVFPAALAKKLNKLEELEISDCKALLEIVEKEGAEDVAQGSEELSFPSLSSLNLYRLPQLTYFHPGRLNREELTRLDVLSCGKLELFQCAREALPEGQDGILADRGPVSSDQKVIPDNLEALTLNWKDTDMLSGRQEPVELDKLTQLKLWFDDADEVPRLPFELFVKGVKAPNLKLLQVSRCSGLEEIFPSQNDKEIGKDGILGHLKEICLLELSGLKSIGLEHSWVSRLCEKLQTLTVDSCPRLTTLIVQVQPGVSFSHLNQLTVQDCPGLKNLFTSSMAKNLKSLQEMRVQQCESMEEVVVAEGLDGTNAGETKFERLKTIVLDSLTSLRSFYSGNDTLQLPSLIKVVIRQCPKMMLFSEKSKLAESSSRIHFSLDSDHALVLHNDINAMFLRQATLSVGDYPLLQKIWLREEPVPERCFSNLKSLVVEGCDFLSNAILPSHILSSLSNLEELQVRKCNRVEAIFDHKGPPASDPLNICFKKLILEKLPNLKHVWDDDPQGSLQLSCLEKVSVNGCKSIISLSVDKRLKKLHVKNCEGLVEIVAKDGEATKGATILSILLSPLAILFSRLSLTSLRLRNLPNLKRIYPGMLFQGWLKLKALDVSLCQMQMILETEFHNALDSHPKEQDSPPTDQQAFGSLEKVTHHLEQLSLNEEDTMMIVQGSLCVDLQNLKFLKFQFFNLESDVFPYWFFSMVSPCNIEKLGVVDSAFKEIFPSQKPDLGDTKILSQLKGLELARLSELKSIGFEHSWIKPFPENLQTLVVLACNSLKNLAPSTISFSHLTELIVENCKALDYLFTSSTAKSLSQLKKMSITNCISMKTIVAEEGQDCISMKTIVAEEGQADEDEMKFGKLKILSLSKLPMLGSFYMGTSTLNFPSLEEVSFTRCHNMKNFCNGDVTIKNLEAKIDGVCWHGDLNTVIKRQSREGSSQS